MSKQSTVEIWSFFSSKLGADANICMTEASRHSPLTIAAYMGHQAICELLLAHNADARYAAGPKDSEPFLTAGGSAADIAAQRGHEKCAALLRAAGAKDVR